MIRPSIRQLSYLVAIHTHGSFSAAADACAVTQSTLSAGIKELEIILNHPLVNRNRPKKDEATTLTPFGLETLKAAQKILNDTDQIIARSKHLDAPLTGPLRLGIIPTIAPYMLPEILPKLTHKFPDLELQLHEDLTDRLLESLAKNQIDLALMAFPYETKGMTQHILFEEPFLAAMPAPLGVRERPANETINIRDLKPETLLLLEDGHCLRDHALTACKLQTNATRKTFSATSLPTLIQMVSAGFGMTLLPQMACKAGTLPPNIHLTPFQDKTPPTRQIGLCWRENDVKARDYKLLTKHVV